MNRLRWKSWYPSVDLLAGLALVLSSILNGLAPRLMSLGGETFQPVVPFSNQPMSSVGADFAAGYTVANSWLAGLEPYEIHPERGNRFADPYPLDHRPRFAYLPFTILLYAPFARVEFLLAYRLWTAIQVSLLLASVGVLASLVSRWRGRLLFGLIAANLLFLSPDFWLYLERGQSDVVVLFILSLSLVCLVRRKDSLAAALIGLASLLKIYPVIFMILFPSRRQWRASAWGLVVLAAGLILFLPWIPSFLSFFFDIGRGVYAETNSRGADSLSLYGIVQDSFVYSRPLMQGLIALDDRLSADLLVLPSENTGLFGRRQIDLLANYGSVAVVVGLLAVLALHARHFDRRGPFREWRLQTVYLFAAGTCIMLLVPPFSWGYRTLWSLVFLLFLFVLLERRAVPWRHFLVVALIAVLLNTYLPGEWGTLLTIVLLSLYAILRISCHPWRFTTTLVTCFVLAFLFNLPFGKAWLLCLLTFYFFLESPHLIDKPADRLSAPVTEPVK